MKLIPFVGAIQLASAFVIPDMLNSINLQETFQISKQQQEQQQQDKPYDSLPFIDTEQLQNLIKLDDLNSSAIELFEIAKKSQGKYGHPTRVIGSPGHWATIDYILETLGNFSHYYTFYTQEFGALDGRVFNHSLSLNNELQTSKTFQLTPPAHITNADLFIVANLGCDESDYDGLPQGDNVITLVKRGVCPFGDKSSLSGKFGAGATLIYDPNSEEIISGTLGEPTNFNVGTLGIKRSLANQLIDLHNSNKTIKLNVSIDSYVGFIKTKNVIAETIHGDHDNVVSLGAHSDSVEAGPGINDDGSGTISLLTVAKQLSNFQIENSVRFAWWAAEEEGLLGSNYYANNLTPEENSQIRLFFDYDMMASPNYEYQIYNGSNLVNPPGSEEIKNLYIDWYESQGLNWTLIPFDGRSDYVGFIENGIPGGGIAAGAEGLNSANGQVLDQCYHLLCDDLTNIAWDAFEINTKLIAHSVATFAKSFKGFPLRQNISEELIKTESFPYRGSNLIY